MAVSKTARTLIAATVNAAGATTTGDALDLTTAWGLSGVAVITNGATAPTAGCAFSLEVSTDGTTWRPWLSVTAGLTAAKPYPFAWSLPAEIMYVRAVFGGNAGQDVTVECLGHELTSV